LGWPLPGELDDGQLETRLFTTVATVAETLQRVMPDMAHLRSDLTRDGVTLQLLWVAHSSRSR